MRVLFFILFCNVLNAQIQVGNGRALMPDLYIPGYAVEGGSDNHFTLTLQEPPSDTTWMYYTYDNTKLTLSPDSIFFTASDYNTRKTVTVTAVSLAVDTMGIETLPIRLYRDGGYCGKLWVQKFDNHFDSTALLTYQNIDSLFHADDSLGYVALRDTLINFVYMDGSGIPTRQPDTVWMKIQYGIDSILYKNFHVRGYPNLKQVDRFAIVTKSSVVDTPFVQYFYHAEPLHARGEAVLLSGGHPRTPDCFVDYWVSKATQYFLTRGYDIFYSQMVNLCGNTGPLMKPNAIGGHNDFDQLETPTYNPISAFTTPWIVIGNWIQDSTNISKVYMTGISGGGWISTFVPALDKRIKKSFDIAGGQANNIYDITGVHPDYESWGEGTRVETFYRTKVSYYDLFLLAAQGGNAYKLTNANDLCCWNNKWPQSYAERVSREASRIGGSWNYQQYYYTPAVGGHGYSLFVLDYIYEKLK